jgi:asparagine synthase (glutamine-hydrolysing)
VQEFDLRPHGPRTYAELCAEFRSLFRQAVLRSLDPRGTTAIAVSGGLDSSSIYCVARALEAEGADTGKIIGINFTAEDGGLADERAYTDAICRQYGSGIVRVPMQPGGFLDSIRETMWASESPLVNPAGNLFQRQYEVAARNHASAFVSGYWGDEAFSPFNHWYHLLWSLRLPTLLRVAREHHRWITETPVTAGDTLAWILRGTLGEFSPKWLQRAYRRLRPSMSPHPLSLGRLGACNDVPKSPLDWRPATRFAHWQRDLLDSGQTRHYLQTFDCEAAAFGMRAAHPFLDPDLTQFLLRCDGAQLNPGGRYKGLLRDALRQEVPAMILDRRNKGDFTKAYGVGQRRDLIRALQWNSWRERLTQLGYLPESFPEWANDRAANLTCDRDDAHITQQSTDCVGLGLWLSLFFDRGFEDDVERHAAHGAG